MKSSFLVLGSLLILGYASVKAFPQEIDPSNEGSSNTNNVLYDGQSSPQDESFSTGANDFVLDGNAQSDASTTPITLLNTASELRQYVVSKLHEIYTTLKGCKSKTDVEEATRLDFEHLPKFEDPLYIGNFTKKYKLADVTFYDVTVHGMRNFHSADIHTEQKDRTVDLKLVAENLRITGRYFLTNFFKKAEGPFIVKLVHNVTYHESSIYCRLQSEVDIASSHCGIRYGKSVNDYADLGFFTQLFRGAISNPMIDEVLQKVGREIGLKMRPVLLSKLQETVMGKSNVHGLETLIRSSVSEARNLMMQDEYKNVPLNGETEKVQYGTHDANIQSIFLSGINAFEITDLQIPILEDRIVVDATVHDMNVNGTAMIEFVENDAVQAKVGGPTIVSLPFDVEDLAVSITFEKGLSDEAERFTIRKMTVTVARVKTYPPQDQTYVSQIAAALRDFLPNQLRTIVVERFSRVARSQIETILREAY